MRLWQAFLNYKYEKSLLLLLKAQEKRCIDQIRSFGVRMKSINNEQNQLIDGFNEMIVN